MHESWPSFACSSVTEQKLIGTLAPAVLLCVLFVALRHINFGDKTELGECWHLPHNFDLFRTQRGVAIGGWGDSQAPVKGEVNVPKNISVSADWISRLKHVPIETVIEATTSNACRLFPRAFIVDHVSDCARDAPP